jgi:LPS-assembly lipoprotein
MRQILPFALLLLSACGFHPRGEIMLPPALMTTSLEVADPFSPVARDLRDALQRAGVTLVPAGTQGAGAIRVPVNQVVRDTLVVSANAKVQEYVVRHRVELSAADSAGKLLFGPAIIELNRPFTFDQTQGLAAAQEEELIRGELQREMVQQILRRLETLTAP